MNQLQRQLHKLINDLITANQLKALFFVSLILLSTAFQTVVFICLLSLSQQAREFRDHHVR